MADRCRWCRAELEHCHGTLIHHLLHATECTEDDCSDTGVALHAFAVECTAVGCRCAGPSSAALTAAV